MNYLKVLLITLLTVNNLAAQDLCTKKCNEAIAAADEVIRLVEEKNEKLQQLNLTLVNQNTSLLSQNMELVKRDEKFFTHPAFVLLVGFVGGLLIYDKLDTK